MRYGSKFLMPLAFAALLSLGGCVADIETIETPGGDEPPVDGKVRIELLTPAADYATPATRAGKADEGAIGDSPWVLVFAGEGDDALYSEAARAYANGGRKYVDLTARKEASRLLVLANPQAKFTAASAATEYNFSAENFKTLLEGKTLEDACAMLHTLPLASPQPEVPFTGGALPMSGVAPVAKIGRGEQISVKMARVVAKITVENTAGNFTLTGATVMDAPRRSTLHRLGDAEAIEESDDPADYDEIVEAEDNTTEDNPIYVYESPADGGMFVIVRGEYGGQTNYYKIALVDGSGEALDIVRNHEYCVEIESVQRAGYTSLGDAADAPASNEDIEATVNVTDGTAHDIVDNGRYYLGVSNSQYIVYGDGALTGKVAFTVTTDCSEEVAANSITVSGTGLTLVGGAAIPLAGGAGQVGTRDVTIDIADGFQVGTVTLRLGDLEKVVTVRRGGAAIGWRQPASLKLTDPGDYLSAKLTGGESWLSLSDDDNTSSGVGYIHAPEGGMVYIHAKSNYDPSDVRPSGVVYLSRRDESEGRIKLDISQRPGVDPVLTVTPDALTFNNMGSWEDITVTSIFNDGNNTPAPYKVEYSVNGGEWKSTISGSDFGTFDPTRADNNYNDDWTYVFRTDLPAADTGGANLTYTLDFESAPIETTEDAADVMRNIGTMGGTVNLAAGGETANCYVVNGPGRYSLPLYYGNARNNPEAYQTDTFVNHAGEQITGAPIAGAHDAVVVWQDTRYLVTDPKVEGGNLTFDIQPGDIRQGNAVVAVRNAGGTILWSWHIWVTTDDIFDAAAPATDAVTNQRPNPRTVDDVVYYTEEMGQTVIPTTYDFMQYHLGWVRSKTTTYYPYTGTIRVRVTQTIEDMEEVTGETNLTRTVTVTQGGPTPVVTGDNAPYWQWGRKDPMPPSAGIRGGESNADDFPGRSPERLIYWSGDWIGKKHYGAKQRDDAGIYGSVGTATGETFSGRGYYSFNRSTDMMVDYSMQNTILYPDAYFNTAAGDGWPTRDTEEVAADNLWDADNDQTGYVTLEDNNTVKTVYDPNPVGFKMPPSNAFLRFTHGGIAEATLNWYGGTGYHGGWDFHTVEGNNGPCVFYPAAGHRKGFRGLVASVLFGGNCWTAKPGYPTDRAEGGWADKPRTHAINLGFNDDVWTSDGDPANQGAGAGDYPWSYGLNVRPVRDN